MNFSVLTTINPIDDLVNDRQNIACVKSKRLCDFQEEKIDQ